MRYDVTVSANTPRGQTGNRKISGVTMGSTSDEGFVLNDVPSQTIKVPAKRGQTVLVEHEFAWITNEPTQLDLALRPDPKMGVVPTGLSVDIEPKNFLAFPTAARHSTVVKVGQDVPPGIYLFLGDRGYHIEVVVQ